MIKDTSKMGQVLKDILKTYFINDSDFLPYLKTLEHDVLAGATEELVEIYSQDPNSSTVREFITLLFAGWEPLPGKLGYDGIRRFQTKEHRSFEEWNKELITLAKERRLDQLFLYHISLCRAKLLRLESIELFDEQKLPDGLAIICYAEVKPKNISSQIKLDKNGGAKRDTLKGQGNYTDFHWGRLAEHVEKKPQMLLSGFIDGKLVYIIEFPFSHPSFIKQLEGEIAKKFPDRNAPREKGDYVRSASFTYEHYMDCEEIRPVWVNENLLEKYSSNINRGFYEFLKKLRWEKAIGSNT